MTTDAVMPHRPALLALPLAALLLTALLLTGPLAGAAVAQVAAPQVHHALMPLCDGKVIADQFVTRPAMGQPGRSEYIVQLRNASPAALTLQLAVAGNVSDRAGGSFSLPVGQRIEIRLGYSSGLGPPLQASALAGVLRVSCR